jgi:phenylacetate-CoA ligase
LTIVVAGTNTMTAAAEGIGAGRLPPELVEKLPRWLREVPLYRRAAGPFANGAISAAAWRQFPFITKEDIRRDFPRNFLRPGVELESLLDEELVELEHTAGTSEARTPLLLGLGWWTQQEERALRLNPLVAAVLDEFPGARRATINSPVCSGDIRYSGTVSRADRVVGNALFVSLSRFPFLWGEAELARMAGEVLEWQPQFLDVDPVYGVVFALYCERRGIRLPSLRFILCSYEFLSRAHRRILERVFKVPALNLYGSTETGHLLMEIEDGWMQPSAETAFLEVLPADARGIGELVVTTLTNDYMPLLRYRIGDLVERRESPLGTSYRVHGRVADALVRPDGSRATTLQIDECFGDAGGLAHYQLRGHKDGGVQARFVPEPVPPSVRELAALRESLAKVLGAGRPIIIEPTDVLLAETSGKFRLTCAES